MDIYIKKSIFLEALQLIVNISPKTTTEKITNNVLLETEEFNGKSVLQIKATNHENTFFGKFEIEIIQHGKICVNTSKLFNLVREFRGDKIKIDSTPQNWVFLTSENSKVKLPGVDPTNYPMIEFQPLESEFELPSIALNKAIERTFFSIGENESRRNLMGLNLEIVSSNTINWTGADAFRICRYKTDLETPIEAAGNIIIPKKSLLELKKILDFTKESVKASFSENTFQIETDQIKFKTQLIEAEYPNLDRLIENEGSQKLSVSRKELLNAVKILNTVTDGDNNSIMKLTVMEGKILVESQKMEFGEGNDEIECDYAGEVMSIGLNIKFLLDALQVFEGSDDEDICFNFNNPELPVVILCDEWKNFKTVLMPVRIRW